MTQRVTVRISQLLLLILLMPSLHAATETPAAPIVNASSWLLIDHHSGRRLAFKNTEQRFAPIHFNKLMVAYIAFNSLKMGAFTDDSLIPVSLKATLSPGPRMFALSSSRVAVRDLIKAMIIGRANDAAIALAEYMGSDELAFASIMNSEAEKLKMFNTFYRDTTGNLPTRQYTDADDLAVLVQRIISEHPHYYRWFREREFSHNGITLYNRNALLWREKNVDGLMAINGGHNSHHLIVSGKRDNMRLSAIVLGAPDERAAISAGRQLLAFGFEHFETRKLYSHDIGAINMRVWLGSTETLPVGVVQDLYLTLPRRDFDGLKAKLQLTGVPFAPIERGQALGTLRLTIQDQLISEHKLVALESIHTGGFFDRLFDRAEMWLRDVPELTQTEPTK